MVFTIFHNPHEPKDEEKTNDARIEGMQTCLSFHVIQLLLVKNAHAGESVFFQISFSNFNGKTLHRKAVEITLAWRENDLFSVSLTSSQNIFA